MPERFPNGSCNSVLIKLLMHVGIPNCIYLSIHCSVPNIIGIVGSVPIIPAGKFRV